MKKVKMFDGVRIIYEDWSNEFFPDMSVFDELLVENELKTELIRYLIMRYPEPFTVNCIDSKGIEKPIKLVLVPCKSPLHD